MADIITLDEELINHIAAGEVVERPASVLKELLDNSIDASATKIDIKIKDGGIRLIEVSDNGTGISKHNLPRAFLPHSTSKISSVDDLSEISSLGFRGEALASIAAVSETLIKSKVEDENIAQQLAVTSGAPGEITSTSREVGTTVAVQNIFSKVPARKKFLKTARTEYRKIMETFIPFALIYPNVHFTFTSENRTVQNLPAIKDATPGTLHPQRVSELFPDLGLEELFYDGEGIVVGGFVAHPSHKSPRASSRFIFVNGRPIWDGGIAKSVQVGAGRFLPEGMRVPFFVAISIPYSQVDVNVHPRKAEVRFANPYRIYSAVESAVKKAYENHLGKEDVASMDIVARRFRGNMSSVQDEKPIKRVEDIGARQTYDVKRSIEFSERLLEDAGDSIERSDGEPVRNIPPSFELEMDGPLRARPYLNRYIIAELEDSILIVDQHAAAERIRFESLLDDYSDDSIDTQSVMIPVEVKMAETEAMFAEEQKDVFSRLGYEIEVKKHVISINSVPAILADGDHEGLFRAIFDDIREIEDFAEKDAKIKEKYRDSVIATMACHTSVRMNQRLSDAEAANLVKSLQRCNNSYTCPHGRPIVWKLTPEEIDRNFDR